MMSLENFLVNDGVPNANRVFHRAIIKKPQDCCGKITFLFV